MSWRKLQFKDIVEFPPKVNLGKDELYDFIPMDKVDGGNKFVQEVDQRQFMGGGAKFANGDTLFARITPCLENGKIAKVKNLEKGIGFGSTEFFVFRAKEGVSDPDFVYYLSKTDTIRQPAIKSMVGASGRQRADKGVVEEIEVDLPPLPTQRRIAAILSAYDDLIENNLRRIKLLEEAAQHIYREWFVRMRFPGWETVRFGEDGLPEGWRYALVSEIMELNYGKSLKQDIRNEFGTFPVYGSSGVVGYHDQFMVEGPGIILGRKGNVGSTFICFKNFFPIDTVYFVISSLSLWYTYLFLSNESYVNSDSAVPGLNRNYAYSKRILVPDKTTLEAFDNNSSHIYRQIDLLKTYNERLKEARDILLPRLMNQTIEV